MSAIEQRLAVLGRAVGWIVALVGALIVLGWALDEVIVPSGVEDATAVKANAGVCFLLAGIALAVRWSRRAVLVSRLLGAGVALIGALTVIEYLFGTGLGIDQLLFSDRSSMHPGRMPPNTAAGCFLLGAALLLPEPARGGRDAGEGLALIAALIGWLALLGLAADLPELIQVGDFVRMAAPSAACFVLLGSGIALAARRGRLAALTASEGPGGPLARRLLLTVLVVPPAVALVLRAGRSAGILDEGAVILLLLGSVATTLLAVALSFAHSQERADEERSIEQERKQAILDTARDAIVSADSTGRIVAFNLSAERIFGLPAPDALGQPLTILMPARFRAAHQAGLRRFLAGGEARVVGSTAELVGRRADGEEFPLELSLAKFEQAGETFFTGTLNDITARKRDEAYRAAQHEVSRVFVEAEGAREALTELAQALGEQLGWQWAAFWAVDPTGETISCEALWNDPACPAEPFVRATRAASLRRGRGLAGAVWASGVIEWMDDVAEDPRFSRTAAAAESGLQSAVAVPLRRAGEVVGVLELLSPGVRLIDEQLVDVLHGIGSQVGQFRERKLAEEGIVRQARELERRARELERRAGDLARSNAELEQFAYVASHDLQEPLRSVAGFVQLLQRRYEGQLDPEADRFIGFAVAGAQRMQTLIEDLLSYSRAGRRELKREQVDSRAVVQRTLAGLEAAMRDAGAEVELGDLPTLDADEVALGQVFQNLIGNALKYQDGEPPRVAVSAAHCSGAWSFTVADNGIGIEPGHAERIFRMFQRLHARDEYDGTGIGLAICEQVVERHGGRIWCDPRPGGGSAFHFTIPDRARDEEPI